MASLNEAAKSLDNFGLAMFGQMRFADLRGKIPNTIQN